MKHFILISFFFMGCNPTNKTKKSSQAKKDTVAKTSNKNIVKINYDIKYNKIKSMFLRKECSLEYTDPKKTQPLIQINHNHFLSDTLEIPLKSQRLSRFTEFKVLGEVGSKYHAYSKLVRSYRKGIINKDCFIDEKKWEKVNQWSYGSELGYCEGDYCPNFIIKKNGNVDYNEVLCYDGNCYDYYNEDKQIKKVYTTNDCPGKNAILKEWNFCHSPNCGQVEHIDNEIFRIINCGSEITFFTVRNNIPRYYNN